MADETTPLTDEERSELEALRAEKEKREASAKAAKERTELERLRAQQARAEHDAAEDARIREIKEKTRDFVEPDDDYKMPLMQKIVLIVLAVIVIIFVVEAGLK